MPAMPPSYPVIVVPGITANYLTDEYPLPPEIVWSVMTNDYERASLHPDDLRFDAQEPAQVRAGQLFEVAYKELIEALRHNLRDRADVDVPVFPFSYDWRQPLYIIEQQLEAFIEEVIARTGLLRSYYEAGYLADPKVNLLGHSMGGLIIAGYLQAATGRPKVAKVATLASPFQGSFEAVIKISTGTANLGTSAPSSREREAARVTPGLYHLIPSFQNGLVFPPDFPPNWTRSLYAPETWQPSILDTIGEYVRLHGRSQVDPAGQAAALFDRLLAEAKQHRDRIDGMTLVPTGLTSSDWLCVVGVDSTTRVRLSLRMSAGKSDFNLQSSDRTNLWKDPDKANQRLTGDGTVPFEGAIPKFLALENLICVTQDDFGYWEVIDSTLASFAGFHGIMPNMNMLHRLIVAHFTGRRDTHGNIWGRPAPGVAVADWKPAVSGLPAKP
jgi:pimeloyl-ACP methyl ester carboxylesterase